MERMKGMNYGLSAALLLLALCLAALSGCVEPAGGSDAAGSAIRFGARTSGSGTKTVYAGNAGDVERLDWESGDRVTVISPLAKVYDKSTNPYGMKYSHTNPTNYSEAEYRITTVSVGSSGTVSDADLDNYGDSNGLLWDQAGIYDFVAMYPSASFSPENSGVKAEWTTSGRGKLSAVMPKEQKPRGGSPTTTSGDITRVWPDMRYAYMYAGRRVNLTSTTGVNPLVNLQFYPMVTTFQFTVKADDATKEVGIARLELVSSSCALSGSYTAEIEIKSPGDSATRSSAGYVQSPYGKGVNDTVRFQLPVDGSGNPTVKVTSGKAAVITLFVVPKGIPYKTGGAAGSTTITDLTLRFSLVIEGKKVGRSLDLRPVDPTNINAGITLSAKNFVEFPAGKKVNINGLTLPTQTDPWRFTVVATDLETEPSDVVVAPVSVKPWDYDDGGRLDQMTSGTAPSYNRNGNPGLK